MTFFCFVLAFQFLERSVFCTNTEIMVVHLTLVILDDIVVQK